MYLNVGFFTHLKYFTKYYFSLQCDPFTTVTFILFIVCKLRYNIANPKHFTDLSFVYFCTPNKLSYVYFPILYHSKSIKKPFNPKTY